jgi:DNA anti-recombination protein RmuC
MTQLASALTTVLSGIYQKIAHLSEKVDRLMANLDPAVVALQAANAQLTTDVANLVAAINLILPQLAALQNQAANDAAISAVTTSTTALDGQVTGALASITAAQAPAAATPAA